jgi:FkbM family methyltransferase
MTSESLDISVRGVDMKHHVGNARLRSWAENMERIEPEILDWIDGFESGSVLFDLGASIGLFAIYAAIRARARVVAFEPEAQNYATMELNHFLNRDKIVHPLIALNLALSDSSGLGSIFCRYYGAGEHVKILDRSETRDTREQFTPAHVQATLKQPLDKVIADYGLPAPSYLKIDVDGAEKEVLGGATRTLANSSLRSVFIETYEPEGTSSEEAAILERNGLRLSRRVPVARLRGGTYPDLYNCVFNRN